MRHCVLRARQMHWLGCQTVSVTVHMYIRRHAPLRNVDLYG